MHSVREEQRLHADADRRLRRAVGRELLVPEDERVGEHAAADVRAARRRRLALAPPDDGAGRRVQSRPIAARRKASSTPAVSVQLGAHGQLQGLGAHWELWMFAAGRHDAAAGDPRRDASTARATSAWTRTSARSRRASSPTCIVLDGNPLDEHPQQRGDRQRDAERPYLRRHDDERDRQPSAPAPEAVLGTVTARRSGDVDAPPCYEMRILR